MTCMRLILCLVLLIERTSSCKHAVEAIKTSCVCACYVPEHSRQRSPSSQCSRRTEPVNMLTIHLYASSTVAQPAVGGAAVPGRAARRGRVPGLQPVQRGGVRAPSGAVRRQCRHLPLRRSSGRFICSTLANRLGCIRSSERAYTHSYSFIFVSVTSPVRHRANTVSPQLAPPPDMSLTPSTNLELHIQGLPSLLYTRCRRCG